MVGRRHEEHAIKEGALALFDTVKRLHQVGKHTEILVGIPLDLWLIAQLRVHWIHMRMLVVTGRIPRLVSLRIRD